MFNTMMIMINLIRRLLGRTDTVYTGYASTLFECA